MPVLAFSVNLLSLSQSTHVEKGELSGSLFDFFRLVCLGFSTLLWNRRIIGVVLAIFATWVFAFTIDSWGKGE